MPLKKSSQKDEIRSKILREMSVSPKSRALILIDIADADIVGFLFEVGKSLDIAMVVATWSAWEKWVYAGYDAVISDGVSSHLDMVALVQSGVVPILPVESAFSTLFTEFDPMRFVGNAFLFATVDKYLIFEKLVRYLENIRYAGDKRTLMTNLEKTF